MKIQCFHRNYLGKHYNIPREKINTYKSFLQNHSKIVEKLFNIIYYYLIKSIILYY